MTLQEYLNQSGTDTERASVVLALADAVREIAQVIKVANTGAAGTTNQYGEVQMQLDVISDRILGDALKQNPHVGLLASEEMDAEVEVSGGRYGVCLDPLDGSSLIDVNFSVGTIAGVYDCVEQRSFVGRSGREQVAALAAVYGPRTTLLCTVGQGTHEFLLSGEEFVLFRQNLKIGEGAVYAPGNLRAVTSNSAYRKMVEYWMEHEYTLRYSGGMVPDINHILVKGKGVFAYPGSDEAPEGKLRLLFECAPMAFLVEEAGGRASDGSGHILDKTVQSLLQRTPIFIGSQEEVVRCEGYLA